MRYQLATNNGPNHLHGGLQGFDKVLWNYDVNDKRLILTYNSPHLEEGYPGALLATVTFELTADNDFVIDYKAVTSRGTPVNLTNHSYFNLAGHGAGWEGLKRHEVVINADRYTEVDLGGIPTGKNGDNAGKAKSHFLCLGHLLEVAGTDFDLRVRRPLADLMHQRPGGFDHNFCIQKASPQVRINTIGLAGELGKMTLTGHDVCGGSSPSGLRPVDGALQQPAGRSVLHGQLFA